MKSPLLAPTRGVKEYSRKILEDSSTHILNSSTYPAPFSCTLQVCGGKVLLHPHSRGQWG